MLKVLNFSIHQWKGYNKNDSLVTKDTLAYAFDFPRKSGAIEASYKDNVFRLKTSRVSELSIFISPEMVDMDQPVSIYVDGKKVYHQKPTYDRDFLLKNFNKHKDRKALWVEEISLNP